MFKLLCVSIALIATPYLVRAEETRTMFLQSIIPELRSQVGKSLLDVVVPFNNERNLILERLTPQGASFFAGDNKAVGESFDQLRKRSYFALSITTCSGSKSLDAKISSIIAWELVADSGGSGMNDRAYIALHLQHLLELMNSPASISTPSSMRSPRAAPLRGLVFEYVKGDTTETLSVLDDMEDSVKNAL